MRGVNLAALWPHERTSSVKRPTREWFRATRTPPLWSSSHRTEPRLQSARADVAQLVERNLAKVEVAGSSPVVRSEAKIHLPSTVEWPRGEAAACKAAYTGSNPVSTSVQHHQQHPRAIGAVVARFLDTEEVTGSNPVSPTSTRQPLTSGNASQGLSCRVGSGAQISD